MCMQLVHAACTLRVLPCRPLAEHKQRTQQRAASNCSCSYKHLNHTPAVQFCADGGLLLSSMKAPACRMQHHQLSKIAERLPTCRS